MNDQLKITPLTRIGELLEAFPELEEVLIECAPVFKKLKNPILRRTVAKVATVQKAASIAEIDVYEMVAKLRRAAGQSVEPATASDPASTRTESRRWSNPPDWAAAAKVEATVDADALLEAGEVPIGRIAQSARRLSDGRVLLVTSTFPPVPLMEALEKQGFESFTRQAGPKQYETFVCRPSTGAPAGEGD